MTTAPPAEFYDGDLVKAYKQARPPYPQELINHMLKRVGLDKESLRTRGKTPSDITIADICSGTGLLSIPLAKMGYKVICVDPAQHMNSELQTDAEAEGVMRRIKVKKADAHATGIAKGFVDLVTIGTAAHWLAADEHAKEIPAHWKHILREGGQVAVLYSIPSLADPTVKTMDKALRETPSRFPHITEAYRKAAFYIFNEWDTVDRFPSVLLDLRENERGYAVDYPALFPPVEVSRRIYQHPMDAVMAYFKSITLGEALKAHPDEAAALAKYVKAQLPNPQSNSIEWISSVYIGTPREHALSHGEEAAPGARVSGLFTHSRARNMAPT